MKSTRSSFVLFLLALTLATAYCSSPTKEKYTSGGKSVTYEVFGSDSNGPLLIFLHGSSGPDVPLYRQQADYFAGKGYTVLFLHYFDATGSSMPSSQNYALWAKAVEDLVQESKNRPEWSNRKIALMGLSLGASVVLAAGSQRVPVNAIADWYGSLPDDFVGRLKGMPPLLILHGNRDDVIPIINAQQLVRLCEIEHFACEKHFYADQGHGFTKNVLEDADTRTLDFFARTMK